MLAIGVWQWEEVYRQVRDRSRSDAPNRWSKSGTQPL
jgi:hypothetical protein